MGIRSCVLGAVAFALMSPARAEDVTITIDNRIEHQRIDGFGAFGSYSVPWSGEATHNDRFLDQMVADLGLTISRQQVPTTFEMDNDNQSTGSDRNKQDHQFTTAVDEHGIAYADPGSLNLDGFNIDRERGNREAHAEHRPLGKETGYYVALRERARRDGEPLEFIASIWSPPWWQKYIPCYFGTDTQWNRLSDGAQGALPRMHEEFAEYCVAFVKALELRTRPAGGAVGSGVHLYAISPQNEPAFGQTYASCVYSGVQYREMLKVLGHRFEKERDHWRAVCDRASPSYKPERSRTSADFFPDTKIFGIEDVSDTDRIANYFNAIFGDPEAREYLDIAAIHGYGGDGQQAGASADMWSRVFDLVRPYNKPVWQTETSSYGPDWDPMKESLSALAMGIDILDSLRFGNASAWIFWTVGGSEKGKYSLMTRNDPHKTYYILKHHARYVRPGAVRIDVQTGERNVPAVAFHHDKDDTLVIVVINNLAEGRRLDFRSAPGAAGLPGRYRMYVSTRTKDCSDEGMVDARSIRLEAKSIATLVAEGYTPPKLDAAIQILRQPEDVQMQAGGAARVVVTPSGSYPWRCRFSWEMRKRAGAWERVGQDFPSLHLENAPREWDGADVRVRIASIDDAANAVVSRVARLTVSAFSGIEFARAPSAPAIDGEIDRTWRSASPTKARNLIGEEMSHDSIAMDVRGMWDERNLYLLIEIADDHVHAGADGKAWNRDGVELFFDAVNSKKTSYGGEHFQWFFGYVDAGRPVLEPGYFSNKKSTDPVQRAMKKTGRGYVGEMAVPWSMFGVKPQAGQFIGFDAQATDTDKAGANKGKLTLFCPNGDAWKNPSLFGTGRLRGDR
jgi:glucuronoarabinoxylan endo-1,4-beta-xylanase